MFLSEWSEFPSVPWLAGKKPNDSSRLIVVEIARVSDMLPGLFPSWSGLRTYQHAGKRNNVSISFDIGVSVTNIILERNL